MPGGEQGKGNKKEDAPGPDHSRKDALEWIIRGEALRRDHHSKDRHIREQCATGEGGAARRHRAASMRRRSQKKKQEDWIFLGEMPQTGSPGAEHEAEATTPKNE